jgi:hypothetical protein
MSSSFLRIPILKGFKYSVRAWSNLIPEENFAQIQLYNLQKSLIQYQSSNDL